MMMTMIVIMMNDDDDDTYYVSLLYLSLGDFVYAFIFLENLATLISSCYLSDRLLHISELLFSKV